MKYQLAKSIAEDLVDYLQPHCSIINIAGSIRREKEDVKDIEIVALPKITQTKDLWGSVVWEDRVPEFIAAANSIGKILKGKADGKYMQIEVSIGNGLTINLDLFMPDAADYYRQFALRTGSADYSFKVLAAAWVKKGWCGSDKGFALQKDCTFYIDSNTGKKIWKCKTLIYREQPPHWQSEEEFFEWLGLPYVEPKLRNV